MLSLIVRQFDMETGTSTQRFFGLVEPENSQSITLYNSIIASLKENDIPISNFIGFASDNAATMVGRKSGVVILLKNNIPNIFHIGCMCHTVALMNNAALVHVPKDVEELCKNMYNYFKSASRKRNFKQLQSIFDVPEHNLLQLCNKRWLSLESMANRIVEQWSVLQHFFILEKFESRAESDLKKILSILDGLSSVNLTYLNFLTYILNLMNDMNLNFQSVSSKIVFLVSTAKELLRKIFKNFIKKEYMINDVDKIKYENVECIKSLSEIYIALKAEHVMLKEHFSENEIKCVKGNILKYYQKLCYEILQRVDISEKRLKVLSYLDPLVIKSNEDVPVLDLIHEYSQITETPEAVIEEYKLLECKANYNAYKKCFEQTEIEMFWHSVGNVKNKLNESLFENLYFFVANILTLPHSSASAERLFSKLSLFKNKVTNRLQVKTCNSMISALDLVDGKDLDSWVPEENLIAKYMSCKF